MKFSEIPYSRITNEQLHNTAEEFLKAFSAAETAAEADSAIRRFYNEYDVLETTVSIAYIRYHININDEFYKAEQEYYDSAMPAMMLEQQRIIDAVLASKFRSELEKSLGTLLFRKYENQRRLINEAVLPDMQEENQLISKYTEILGGAEIPFDGKTLNLTQLDPYRQSPDRAVRKAATEAYFKFFSDRQGEFDELYGKLVTLRASIAEKLGFADAVALGYAQMERFDYDEDMVAVYREEIKKYITPLVSELKERQRRRIGVDKMYFYDNGYYFKSGNPIPIGTPDELVASAQKMYRELSPESGEFFDFMVENELLDLLAKPGKMTGGFCTGLPQYKMPFIFSNFTGTKEDVDVLTHEAGHALQAYLSAELFPEYRSPTYESCEIHSMSMELITRPWMKSFFGADAEKFLYLQLDDILNFLPYGVLVDDFQHFVYHNPAATADERAAEWRRLEREYMPWLDYDGDEYLDGGRRWQRQSHIYQRPFYYIDYTLAQVCAMQFFLRFNAGDENAWSDYLKLCRLGGSETFVSLVGAAGLKSPFVPGVLQDAAKRIKAILEQTDDSAL
ncbi:MAG: M3 family oligoendopeptidase [Oscillospiraceae bacterium]|jgi:M3 family oligoendopeptidase|nr:M3 family oligoendopeptidase [Oscillospiraceae bacterium]